MQTLKCALLQFCIRRLMCQVRTHWLTIFYYAPKLTIWATLIFRTQLFNLSFNLNRPRIIWYFRVHSFLDILLLRLFILNHFNLLICFNIYVTRNFTFFIIVLAILRLNKCQSCRKIIVALDFDRRLNLEFSFRVTYILYIFDSLGWYFLILNLIDIHFIIITSIWNNFMIMLHYWHLNILFGHIIDKDVFLWLYDQLRLLRLLKNWLLIHLLIFIRYYLILLASNLRRNLIILWLYHIKIIPLS